MVKRYNENEIEKLVEILKNDGVMSVPTDTVFGLCGIISSEKAKNKLISIKKRPESKSFPIMCCDINQIREIAVVNEKVEKIINTFMPGPITLVLKKKENLPSFVTNGKETVAIRMATSKELEELIRKVGSPLYMTSANESGKKTCSSLDEIEKECPDLDGMLEGKIIYDKSSTIVDCTNKKLIILREGPITLKEIEKGID